MIVYIMIFVHNDRVRTVHDDIQTVKIDIQYLVYILIEYFILYRIIFHEYHYIRISVLTDPHDIILVYLSGTQALHTVAVSALNDEIDR